MYAMVVTTLVMGQAIDQIISYMSKLRRKHKNAVKQILRYLKGITDCGIVFEYQKCVRLWDMMIQIMQVI